MIAKSIYFASHFIMSISLLISIIFGFGIVWRVEKKLDTAFKLFLSALIVFSVAEAISILRSDWIISNASFLLFLKAISSLLLLFGMFEMRSMLRKIDGELDN